MKEGTQPIWPLVDEDGCPLEYDRNGATGTWVFKSSVSIESLEQNNGITLCGSLYELIA